MNDDVYDVPDAHDAPYTETNDDDFSDVFDVSLIQQPHQNGFQLGADSATYTVAKYDSIKVVEIERKAITEAKAFVQKVTAFVTTSGDDSLKAEHIDYLKQVSKFKIQNLSDLLRIAKINSMMINNIVERINSTVAEDYAMVASYNNLITLHMKLIREIQNLYTSIPSQMRKMKAEMLAKQEVSETASLEPFSTNLGETHFNNQKQLLARLAEGIKDSKD
jgi:hypothetical protein